MRHTRLRDELLLVRSGEQFVANYLSLLESLRSEPERLILGEIFKDLTSSARPLALPKVLASAKSVKVRTAPADVKRAAHRSSPIMPSTSCGEIAVRKRTVVRPIGESIVKLSIASGAVS